MVAFQKTSGLELIMCADTSNISNVANKIQFLPYVERKWWFLNQHLKHVDHCFPCCRPVFIVGIMEISLFWQTEKCSVLLFFKMLFDITLSSYSTVNVIIAYRGDTTDSVPSECKKSKNFIR